MIESNQTGNRTVSITGFAAGKGKSDVIIGATVSYKWSWDTYKIVKVKENAFSDEDIIESVQLFNAMNLTEIGENAFQNCANLRYVVFPSNNLSNIGNNAFSGGKSLQAITVFGNSSSTTLGENLFKNSADIGSYPYPVTFYSDASNMDDIKNRFPDSYVVERSTENVQNVTLKTPKIKIENSGETATLEIQVPYGTTLGYPQYGIHFQAVNENVATVDQKGVVTAVADGITFVRVFYGDESTVRGEWPTEQHYIRARVTVGSVEFGDISITPADVRTVLCGKTLEYELTVVNPKEDDIITFVTATPDLVEEVSRTPIEGKENTYKVVIRTKGYGEAGFSYRYSAADGTIYGVASADLQIKSNVVDDSYKWISRSADHVVLQEISYCGRGNNNEPLTRILFSLPGIEGGISGNETADSQTDAEMIAKLQKYAVTVKPHFDSVLGNPEITRLHAYIRLYPQVGNPLRGDMWSGLNYGKVPTRDVIDLGVFDYRAPLLAANQTVYDLGYLNDGNNVDSDAEYSVSINEKTAAQIVARMKSEYRNLQNMIANHELSENINEYYDPRFYIYICADINPKAADVYGNETALLKNKIGAVVTKVVAGDAEYEGNGILSANYMDVGGSSIFFPKVGDVSEGIYWGANLRGFRMRAQTPVSRTILYQRVMAYMPYDGYSRYYRIPGLTDLSDGTLIMTSDARKFHNHDVSNNFDVISRISRDNGATWSDPNTVAEGYWGSDKNCTTATGYGDAALGKLPTPGNVLAVFIGGKGLQGSNGDGPNISYSVSTTSGRSWSEPKRIPTEIFSYDKGDGNVENDAVASPGPGRMCPITTGKHAGKVMFAAYQWAGGNGANGPLTFLAYDDITQKWTNLGHLGDARDCQFGESQLVEIPQADGEPLFLLTVRNEKGGTTDARKWFVLKPSTDKDDKYYLPSFNKADNTSVANMKLLNAKGGGASITELTENAGTAGFTFGSAAGPCNSNIFVYKETNGNDYTRYYLMQSMPTATAKEMGARRGSTNRTGLILNMADISSLYNEGKLAGNALVWMSTGLNLSDPLNRNITDIDTSTEGGFVNVGYSCVSAQVDGRIGLATEEYPIMYRPAADEDCKSGGTDVLLGGWYNSISFKALTGNDPVVTGRELPKPEISPYNSTFKIDPTNVTQNDAWGPAHVGVFDPESTRELPTVKISVDPAKVKVRDDEKWRIDFDLNFRPHGAHAGVEIIHFYSPWYDPTDTDKEFLIYDDNGSAIEIFDEEGKREGELKGTTKLNPDGMWTVSFKLPMRHYSFLNLVSKKLENVSGVIGIENAREEGYWHTEDSYVIRALVGAYDKDYESQHTGWDAARKEAGVINATGYYAVSPSRKLKVKIMPEGVDAIVELSTGYSTATFDGNSNVLGNDASRMWLFARPSYDQYPVRISAIIPDGSPAEFIGFTVDGSGPPTTINGHINTSDEKLLRNLRGAWIESVDENGNPKEYGKATKDNTDYPVTNGQELSNSDLKLWNVHVYDNSQQLQFYVPSKYSYEGDADDYDAITIYGWFNSNGGLYTSCDLGYTTFDIKTESKLASQGGWVSDTNYMPDVTVDDQMAHFLERKPNPEFEVMRYPVQSNNVANVFNGENESLCIPKDGKHGFGGGYYTFTFVPDKYGYKHSAVLSVWKRAEDGLVHSPANTMLTVSNERSGSLNEEEREVKLINISGRDADYGSGDYSWCTQNGLPCEVRVPVSFNGSFAGMESNTNLQAGDKLGAIVLTVTERPVKPGEENAFLQNERIALNLTSASSNAAPRRKLGRAEVDAPNGAPRVLYRIQYPITYSGENILTSVEDIDADEGVEVQAEYYDVLGRRVMYPVSGEIYIVKRGSKVTKEVFRNY